MAAPRFSPVLRLFTVAVALYATVAVLAVWLGPSLRFAASQLPSYLEGSIDVPEHSAWEDEAATLIDENRELDRAKSLLERAWAAEPNASTQLLLGELSELDGKPTEALTHYRASLDLDPAQAEPYLRIAGIARGAGNEAAASRILEEGITALERAVRLQVPVPDGTVRDVYNAKAREVHDDLASGLASLREATRDIR